MDKGAIIILEMANSNLNHFEITRLAEIKICLIKKFQLFFYNHRI